MAKKQIDPLVAKQKRQKIIAIVGCVILVGLLVLQGPKVLKRLNQKPIPQPTAAPNAGMPQTPLAAPTLSGGQNTPAAGTSSDAGSDGLSAPVQDGQLASFGRFSSKDPFAQQLAAGSPGPDTSGSSGGDSSSAPSGSAVPTSSGSTGGTEPAPGGAVISVNGVLTTVAVDSDFPQDGSTGPIFHLVSLTAHTAKVAIAGGSYSSGATTVMLREGKPVTLMNTADGTKYTLVLKPQGTPIPSSGSSTTTTSSPTSTTTPTTTTP